VIKRLFSDLPKFKNLEFHPGLNVLVAERTPESTALETRNGAGKSSLIEIIHFLTGGNAGKDSLFRIPELAGAYFGMSWDVGRTRVTVERTGSRHNRLFVTEGDVGSWVHQPDWASENDRGPSLSNSQWLTVLANEVFGVSPNTLDEAWSPKFRSLFSYFARREASGGYRVPTKHSTLQQTGDVQVSLMYLIGTDWRVAREFQQVRERERTLKALRSAVGQGALGPILGTTGDLRTRLALVEDQIARLSGQLSTFQVLPAYEQYEREASQLTERLAELNDQNTMDRRLMSRMNETLNNEQDPEEFAVEQMYAEANISFPNQVRRRLEDVREFHAQIIANRRAYLSGEIDAVASRIAEREGLKQQLDARRAELMRILQAGGALETYASIQSELARLEGEAEQLRQQYESAEYIETERTELADERRRLYLNLRRSFAEQSEAIRRAILAFESVSRRLYEQAGSLTVSETDNGPEFEVSIQAEESVGISRMQIFCFDMMLAQMCYERDLGPGVIVHDSHLFDGVDERQKAQALQLGAELSSSFGFQYIVTMNSDDLPSQRLFSSEFSLEDYILPVQLTDASEDGGLFGFRFG
jgi:uncharacterized protein YydD (DUF2326 family)